MVVVVGNLKNETLRGNTGLKIQYKNSIYFAQLRYQEYVIEQSLPSVLRMFNRQVPFGFYCLLLVLC